MDSLNLRQRLYQLNVRAAQLEGARKSDCARNDQLHEEVGLSKGRLALGEEIARVFEALQQRSHERSVGAFQRLLTAILNDVLPEEGTVRLLPQFKSNATWLDIALEKNGNLEDVAEGNGGAVTNVVCAGLRFAALSRTANRRLMILDEPDCWLKPDRVPAFVRVVAQVAEQTDTQTFFITHHDPAIFEGHVNVVRLSSDESGTVSAQALTPLVSQWKDDSQPGIRAIELINVRRHEHTLLPCFPGATAYIGDNNLGKSTAVVTSVKAVAYGESDDTLIRHGCNEARIIFYLENDRRIEWSRALKRSPAVVYKLFKGDVLEAEGRPKSRNQAPEWVTEVLGISRVDDLDIQVGNQKSPVFLLNDSAPRRAQILSVGRESGHLKSLMKKYTEMKSADQETVKQGELALARLKVRLGYLSKVEPLPAQLEALLSKSEQMLKQMETCEKLGLLVARIEAGQAALQKLVAEERILHDLPVLPELADEAIVAKYLQTLSKLARFSTLPEIPAFPEVPVLSELSQVQALGQRIGQAQKVLNACCDLPPEIPALPELAAVEAIQSSTQKILAQSQSLKVAEQDLILVSRELDDVHEKLETLKEELGGECPLCGAAFPQQGVEHHVH